MSHPVAMIRRWRRWSGCHAFMRRQYGLITRDQALECGLTARADRVAAHERSVAGSLRPDVYATRRHPADLGAGRARRGARWRRRRRRVARHGGPAARLSSTSRTWVSRSSRRSGATSGSMACVGHRSGALFESDLTVYRSIPTTTVARTLIDVSSRLTERRFGQAVDDALRRRILRLDDLRRTAGRLGSAPWPLDATSHTRSWRRGSLATTRSTAASRSEPSGSFAAAGLPRPAATVSDRARRHPVPPGSGLSRGPARHRARRVGVAPHPIGVR